MPVALNSQLPALTEDGEPVAATDDTSADQRKQVRSITAFAAYLEIVSKVLDLSSVFKLCGVYSVLICSLFCGLQQEQSFRRLILNQCQTEFERSNPQGPQQQVDVEKLSAEEREEHEGKIKRRLLGNSFAPRVTKSICFCV